MPDEKVVLVALKKFADAVTAKMTTLTVGVPDAIPEPATMSLLALGGLALVKRRRGQWHR